METLQEQVVSERPKLSEILAVGPDRLTIKGREVVIEALHEMPDWQVREYCRIPVRFQNRKYYLRQKAPGQKPYAMRYFLTPWDADSGTAQSGELCYDEQSVAEREGDLKTGQFESATRAVLLIFFPFLGLLWSGTKEKLARFGFAPRTITGVSIMLTFCVMLLDGMLVKILMVRSLRSGQIVLGGIVRAFYGQDFMSLGPFELRVLWLDCILFALLILDVIIRYSQHLGEAESPWGFAEWLTYPFRRKKASAVAKV